MAEGALIGATDAAGATLSASTTYYGSFAQAAFATFGLITTEANAYTVHRGLDCILRYVRLRIPTNGINSSSTFSVRKNGATTAATLTIGSGNTGIFTDLTNAVALTDGDTYGYALVVGSSVSGALIVSGLTAELLSSGQSQHPIGFAATVTNTFSGNRFVNMFGAAVLASTESLAQGYMPAPGVASNLRLNITSARLTGSTIKTRKNGSDGGQSVSVSGTGIVEDISGTDTFAAGDLFDLIMVNSTGADSLTITSATVLFTPSGARVTALVVGANNAAIPAATTRYIAPFGRMSVNATESNTQISVPLPGAVTRINATVSANASTTNVTLAARKNSATTSVALVVPFGATGSFSDLTGTATYVAGDLMNLIGSGATTGSVTFRSMSMLFTADPPESNASLNQTLGGMTVAATATTDVSATLSKSLGAMTVGSAATVDISASLSVSMGGMEVDATATSGASELSASAAITMGGVTTSGAVKVATAASLAKTLGGMTVAGAAAVPVSASLSKSLGGMTVTSAATVRASAAAAITFGSITSTAAASVGDSASASVPMGAMGVAATATVLNRAGASVTMGGVTVSSIGAAVVGASLSKPLGAMTVAASGAVDSSSAAQVTLGAMGVSATAMAVQGAVASIPMGGMVVAGAAKVGNSASLGRAFGGMTVAGRIVSTSSVKGRRVAMVTG